MVFEPWLPVGFMLPRQEQAGRVLYTGSDWQIIATSSGANALLAREALVNQWIVTGLLEASQGTWLELIAPAVWVLLGKARQRLCPVSQSKSPNTRDDAVAFAHAFRQSRAMDASSPMNEAIYVEHIGRLLPTYEGGISVADDLVLGRWLSGGVLISAVNLGDIQKIMSWLPGEAVRDIVSRAGLNPVSAHKGAERQISMHHSSDAASSTSRAAFELVGRDMLTKFFQEHVIDIVENREQYARMGIHTPSGIVLFGPPGCGKTYAVESLVNYLDWPHYEIEASSVASPYIHETSRKVAEVFSQAIQHAPSVIVIDEMESFLASRDNASGHHHVEEVAEFLRRIPEAVSHGVLVIGMTNRIDAIDAAILRRGRFDHLIAVEPANEVEILHLMTKMADSLPLAAAVDLAAIAKALAGHPLSDVTFVMREGARLAVRGGTNELTQAELQTALDAVKARTTQGPRPNPIGFY